MIRTYFSDVAHLIYQVQGAGLNIYRQQQFLRRVIAEAVARYGPKSTAQIWYEVAENNLGS
jgi:hypothetical protein